MILQIGVVLTVTRIVGLAFHCIGQPRVMGEMTAGIFVGPSLLGRVAPDTFAYLFPTNGLAAFDALSQFGLILFLFWLACKSRRKAGENWQVPPYPRV